MKRNVIVTGGNGYIGSHMCRLLHEKGYGVHIIDSHVTSPDKEVHTFGEFHRFDIADNWKVGNLLKATKPEAIFHFAARALVGESEENPFLYYRENFQKTQSLIETCLSHQVTNLIFSSTCAIYGDISEKIREDHPKNPTNSYGLSKYLIERMLSDLARQGRLNAVCLRYFNVAGCSEDGLLGENHDPETHIIPNIIKSLLDDGGYEFTLFGSDYDTRDGSNVRDYIHVVDLVRAHFLAWEYLQNNKGLHQFNLGSGEGSSNLEVVAALEKISGKKIKVVKGLRRPGDPPSLVADGNSAKNILKFEPEYTLENCLQHSLNYLLRQAV